MLVALKLLFQEHFKQVDTFDSPNGIGEQLKNTSYDAIILDMNFARQIMHLPNGHLSLLTKEGQGLTFILEFVP